MGEGQRVQRSEQSRRCLWLRQSLRVCLLKNLLLRPSLSRLLRLLLHLLQLRWQRHSWIHWHCLLLPCLGSCWARRLERRSLLRLAWLMQQMCWVRRCCLRQQGRHSCLPSEGLRWELLKVRC